MKLKPWGKRRSLSCLCYQGLANLRLRQGGLVTGALVLSLGLPYGEAEVQSLTYALEHRETRSKIDLRWEPECTKCRAFSAIAIAIF